MNPTRHALAKGSLQVLPPLSVEVAKAESLETAGNWYLAGEKYCDAWEEAAGQKGEVRAKLLVRAATCFEIACQSRAAGRAYSRAAAELDNNGFESRLAGELYNRAALHFQNCGENFSAGLCWRSAGLAFARVGSPVLSDLDNIHPLPSSAGKFFVAALCYSAAGDAFLRCGDEANWACGAYWEAGKAHSAQGNGYHAFVAYRKALTTVARFYGTHDREELRKVLPLTEKERASKLDPLNAMEQEAYRGNHEHQKMNAGMLTPAWAWAETYRQLIGAYHEFYLTFVASGNSLEASAARIAEKERVRRLMFVDRHYVSAALYWLWGAVSGYGESLVRWAATCMTVLLGFTFIYRTFRLAEPVSHWFDYFYFSVVTFTSLGYGDIHPIGVVGKATACVEIVFGLVMFGLLLTFVGSRFQRS